MKDLIWRISCGAYTVVGRAGGAGPGQDLQETLCHGRADPPRERMPLRPPGALLSSRTYSQGYDARLRNVSSTRRASCCPEVWRTSTGALLKQRPLSHCLACVSRSQRGRKVAATPFPSPRSPQEQRLPDPIHTQNLGCRRVSGECSIWLSCFCSSLECCNTS